MSHPPPFSRPVQLQVHSLCWEVLVCEVLACTLIREHAFSVWLCVVCMCSNICSWCVYNNPGGKTAVSRANSTLAGLALVFSLTYYPVGLVCVWLRFGGHMSKNRLSTIA